MDKLPKGLNGFQTAPRDRFLLLKLKVLTTEEFVLYELALALADWDDKHYEKFGTFKATNQELALLLGWKSDSTVSRHMGNLVKKGYLSRFPNGRINPKHFDKWLWHKKKTIKAQGYLAEMQDEVVEIQSEPANLHELSAKVQKNRAQKRELPLSSYKDDLVSFPSWFFKKTTDQLTDNELLWFFPGATIEGVPSVNR